MSDAALAVRQIRYENKTFWRNPAAAFFTFAFPLMFLVIFNLLFGGSAYRGFGRSVSASTFYTPAIAAFSVISACYTNVAMGLVFSRDQGVLKRVRGTPLPAWAFLFGRLAFSVLVAILLVAITVVFGRIFYDVEIPTRTMPAFLATLGVGAASFCALGMAVAAFVPNADAAPAVVNASILPLLFISDIFIPLTQAPDWLGTIAGVFPVKHFSHAMIQAFNPFSTGTGFDANDLSVMALWGLAAGVVAARRFRWEPRR